MIPASDKDESRSTTAVNSLVHLGLHHREDDHRGDSEAVAWRIDTTCTVHGLSQDLGHRAVPDRIQYAPARGLPPEDGTRLTGIAQDVGDVEAQATAATALWTAIPATTTGVVVQVEAEAHGLSTDEDE